MARGAAVAFRVLIVDAANTGRSAVGERLLRHHLARHGIPRDAVRVASAGLDAIDGGRMDPAAASEIERHGGNSHGFRARSLSRPMVDSGDMIVCSVAAERDDLVSRHPHAAGRVFTLSEISRHYAEAALAAPLAEHPRILAQRLGQPEATVDGDVLTDAELEPGAGASARALDEVMSRIAETWASILPVREREEGVPDAACVVDAFGVAVAVHCAGEGQDELASAGRRAWGRCLIDAREPEVSISLVVDSDPAVLAAGRLDGALAYDSVETALHYLSSAVTVRAIESRAGQLVMMHAAGLAGPDGSVVGFIAPSGTGKTTLSRTLGAHYGYVTDETLAVGPELSVLPYPKPLSVIDAPTSIKEQWGADSLDLAPLPAAPLTLRRLVILDRKTDGPDEPVLTPLGHLEGIALLAEQVSYLTKIPGRLHALSELVDAVGGLSLLTYRDVRTVLPLMPELLGERP